jgi:hypothetical protein
VHNRAIVSTQTDFLFSVKGCFHEIEQFGGAVDEEIGVTLWKPSGIGLTVIILSSNVAAERDGAEPPLAASSVANIENCFIKSNVDFTTASRWLERLVRR